MRSICLLTQDFDQVQFIVALFVLRSGVGYDIFDFISELARDLLGFANQGTIFLTADSVPSTHWFLVTTLPVRTFSGISGFKEMSLLEQRVLSAPSDYLTTSIV